MSPALCARCMIGFLTISTYSSQSFSFNTSRHRFRKTCGPTKPVGYLCRNVMYLTWIWGSVNPVCFSNILTRWAGQAIELFNLLILSSSFLHLKNPNLKVSGIKLRKWLRYHLIFSLVWKAIVFPLESQDTNWSQWNAFRFVNIKAKVIKAFLSKKPICPGHENCNRTEVETKKRGTCDGNVLKLESILSPAGQLGYWMKFWMYF